MGQAQETYRISARDNIDEQYVSPETLEAREKRAKIRALKRRTKADTSWKKYLL